MMTFDQSEEENHKEFVNRLIENGWPAADAEEEWQRIQSGEMEDE